jgi:CheY-like chemotaxis protein
VRILVVDDHRNTLITLAIGLRRAGHSVATAAAAAEALALLEGEDAFDSVVCDVRMQPVGGLELARTLRLRRPCLPIVFMTAYDLRGGEQAEANDMRVPCLLKPIAIEVLLEMLMAVTPRQHETL